MNWWYCISSPRMRAWRVCLLLAVATVAVPYAQSGMLTDEDISKPHFSMQQRAQGRSHGDKAYSGGTIGKDINPDGPCKKEVAAYCADEAKKGTKSQRRSLLQLRSMAQGSGQAGNTTIGPADAFASLLKKWNMTNVDTAAGAPIAKCLRNVLQTQKASIGSAAVPVSHACKSDVRHFFSQRAHDVRNDMYLLMVCAADIQQFCAKVKPGEGRVTACLRANKVSLSDKCSRTVTRRQVDSAEDISLDGKLQAACKDDLAKYCRDIGWGDGAGKACLEDVDKRNRTKAAQQPGNSYGPLSPACKAALYRRALEESEDIRFDVKLASACASDKQKFCPNVVPGRARVISCLEHHKDDKDFSASCKKMLEGRILRKSKDIRMDYRFRLLCREDVESLCPKFDSLIIKPWVKSELRGSDLIECMRDNIDNVKNLKCKDHIYTLQKRGADNPKLDSPLQQGCAAEIKELCSAVPQSDRHSPNMLVACLSRKKNEGYIISQQCTGVVMKRMIVATRDFNLNPMLKASCLKEHMRFCRSLDQAAQETDSSVDCLQAHKHDLGFGDVCKKALEQFTMDMLGDIRLVRDVSEGCKDEVKSLCSTLEPGEGRVINCLQEKRTQITSGSCRSALLRITGLATDDWRMDFNLFRACKNDVDQYCAGIEPGQGRVHACLRANEERISPSCKMMEHKLEEMEMEDIRLNPRLRSCGGALLKFCKDIAPGGSNRIACLQDHMTEPDFPMECYSAMEEVIEKSTTKLFLNPRVKQMCDEDVNRFCRWSEMSNSDPEGGILSCLAKHVQETQSECRRELIRVVRIQMWRYKAGLPLTSPCDGDAERHCSAGSVAAPFLQSGYVAECLMRHSSTISRGCWALVSLPDTDSVRAAAKLESQYWHSEFAKEALSKAVDGIHESVSGSLKQHVDKHVEEHVERAISKKGSLWVLPIVIIILGFMVMGGAIYYTYVQNNKRGPVVIKDGSA